jgi:hypothetical protein
MEKEFKKWFTEETNLAGKFMTIAQLAWNARQPEIDALKAEVSKYREALEDIADGNGDECSDCRYNTQIAYTALANLALEVSP